MVFNMEDETYIYHLQTRIERTIYTIHNYLSKFALKKSISLYAGDLSIILFFTHSYLCTRNKLYLQKVYDYLDSFSLPYNIPFSFCSGLAGYAWFINFLQQNNLVELDDDFFDEIDEILFKKMEQLFRDKKYDLLHEGLSIARYFIARKKKEECSFIIDCLSNSKHLHYNEIKWVSYNSIKNTYRYDFGLSHGNAGFLYILGKCYTLNIQKSLCQSLIDGIFMFYLNNEQDFYKYHSYFPSSVDIKNYSPGNNKEWCRLAWCYGDAGILYSIYTCAELVNNSQMKEFSLKRLEMIANKHSLLDTGVQDASFCHGSSGLCHIFYKLYLKTDKLIFYEAALYWLETTLVLLNFHGNLNYLLEPQVNRWGKNPYLLEGCSGTGIVLEELLHQKCFSWDECFMLS